MKNMTHVDTYRGWTVSLGIALLAGAAVGCGGEGTTQGSAESSTEAPLLFKDPSTTGPRLDVYDFGGEAAISVGAPIAMAARVNAIQATDSLEALYRSVHPEAETVPAELIALSERLAPALAALRSTPRPAVVKAVTIDKSQAGFNAAACRGFREGISRYTPVECQWSTGIDQLLSFHNPQNILAGDRTYGWNNNNRNAIMNWYKGAAIAYSITLPNYWYTWMSLSGGGPYYAQIYLTNGFTGELGLTHHSLSNG